MDDIATLQTVPLFAAMKADELAEIRGIMKDRSFAPGQVIIREGEPGDSFHVITQGNVEFSTLDAEGKEIVLDKAGAGGWFGELSMLTGDPRSARVRAITAVNTLVLGRDEFMAFLAKNPQAGVQVLIVVGRRLARADELLRQSASRNVNELNEEKMTFGQRIADKFASLMGSWTFIIAQSAILAFWATWNLLDVTKRFHWDEYPFIFMNLAMSLQAAYAAPVIMMSQNRSSDKDRMAADIDHAVNMKAEAQTMLILKRLDELEKGMHHLHREQHLLLSGAVNRGAGDGATAR
jgi:CRP/FNR family transcriptional regulator, cyclic AMP receptor protein